MFKLLFRMLDEAGIRKVKFFSGRENIAVVNKFAVF